MGWFNIFGVIAMGIGFGIAYGIGWLVGVTSEPLLMIVGGPLVSMVDVGFRHATLRDDRPDEYDWLISRKGGTLIWIPIWIWGGIWLVIGIIKAIGGGSL